MKHSIILFSGLFLFGCSNKKVLFDEGLAHSLIEANKFEIRMSEELVDVFKYKIMSNKYYAPWYHKVLQFHYHINRFSESLMAFYKSANEDTSILPLSTEYLGLLDTLKKYIVQIDSSSLKIIVARDFVQLSTSHSNKIIALEMMGDLIRNELATLKFILSSISSSDCWTLESYITKPAHCCNPSDYSFEIHKRDNYNDFIWVKKILIDTILRNGDRVFYPFEIEKNWDFARINLLAPDTGNYILKGRIEFPGNSWDGYISRYEDFEHIFKVTNRKPKL